MSHFEVPFGNVIFPSFKVHWMNAIHMLLMLLLIYKHVRLQRKLRHLLQRGFSHNAEAKTTKWKLCLHTSTVTIQVIGWIALLEDVFVAKQRHWLNLRPRSHCDGNDIIFIIVMSSNICYKWILRHQMEVFTWQNCRCHHSLNKV